MTNSGEKKWILEGDYHTGSTTGLCWKPTNKTQERVIKLHEANVKYFGKPDVVVLNGDGIQGSGRKNKDITISNMTDQAVECARRLYTWKAKDEYIIVGGTGFHTEADGEDIDKLVCGELEKLLRKDQNVTTKVTYCDKLKTIINGWFRFEARHKIPSSKVPHGRFTSTARARMWGALSAALNCSSLTDLLAFSHVHYWTRQEDDFGTAITLPCWQALGTKFGSKECDGVVSLGTVQLIVGKTREDGWDIKSKRYLPGVVGRWQKR